MSLISSVSRSRLRIWVWLVEKVSVAVLSAAYEVEHRSEMIRLIRSNPIFCSSLVSIEFFLSSKSVPPVRILLLTERCAQQQLEFVDVLYRRHCTSLDEGYLSGLL